MTRRPAPTRTSLCTAFAVLTLLVPSPARPQEMVANHPRVREALRLLEVWMQAQRDYEGIPGASLAVVHDQELVYSNGFGYAHVAEEVPATARTMYSICSISKLFTSISVMQLRDQGLLSLRDPVAEHLEWFDIGDPHPEAGPVTIEGVLTHSSGLPREADTAYWSGPDYPFPTHEQIVAWISGQEMLYPARTHYQYSNLGLTLAGEIVMSESGMPWGEYVRTHILDPLGMSNTTTEHLDELRGKQLATGYSAKGRDGTRAEIPPYQVRGVRPAAGMLSTVEDLARFASWQFRALEGKDDGVLDRNTLREMQRVHWLEPDGDASYGLGFSISRRNGKTYVGHGGSCPGYESNLTLRPQDKIATTFMTNGRRVSAGRFARTAYDIVAPAIRAAVKGTGAEPADPALERFVGLYSRPLGTESLVLTWEGQLVVIGLPTSDPLGGMTRLTHVEGGSFRRIRDDGDLGEEYLFEEDPDGTMRYWVHNNPRIRTERLPRLPPQNTVGG
ncbi:MAG: serine hydrolase [Gemmatimonadota bacterium]|jgi:CubicO group peptidase (beta-lactamase class C family)